VYGTFVVGLFLSWTTISIPHYYGMGAVVLSFVVSFQIIFASLALFVWNGNSMVAHVDFILSLANPFIDWYLVTQFNSNNGLSPAEITVEVIFLTYITMRMWWRCITRNGGTTGVKALPTLEHLNVVWVTRSTKLVSRLIPDISQQWDQLVDIWGEDASRGMCGVLIFLVWPFSPSVPPSHVASVS
jgi:hypothetical protein